MSKQYYTDYQTAAGLIPVAVFIAARRAANRFCLRLRVSSGMGTLFFRLMVIKFGKMTCFLAGIGV